MIPYETTSKSLQLDNYMEYLTNVVCGCQENNCKMSTSFMKIHTLYQLSCMCKSLVTGSENFTVTLPLISDINLD